MMSVEDIALLVVAAVFVLCAAASLLPPGSPSRNPGVYCGLVCNDAINGYY